MLWMLVSSPDILSFPLVLRECSFGFFLVFMPYGTKILQLSPGEGSLQTSVLP